MKNLFYCFSFSLWWRKLFLILPWVVKILSCTTSGLYHSLWEPLLQGRASQMCMYLMSKMGKVRWLPVYLVYVTPNVKVFGHYDDIAYWTWTYWKYNIWLLDSFNQYHFRIIHSLSSYLFFICLSVLNLSSIRAEALSY